MKNLIHKLLVYLHLKEDYGFARLTYRGLPVIMNDRMPDDHVGFINEETATVKILNWKTGKLSKSMTFKQFYAWLDKKKVKK